jgi:hypothetical protein
MNHFKDDDSNFNNNNNNFDDDDYSEALKLENSENKAILLGMLSLIFFYIFLLCIFYIKNKYICINTNTSNNDIQITLENSINENTINNYGEKIIINSENIINYFDKECSICCNIFDHDDQIIKLNICEHCFHYDCILEWFKREIRCPLCNNTNFVISHQIIS